MEQKMPAQLIWRLHTVMSERGIRTASDLHRTLEPYGIDITSHQLSRIVAKLPARLNTDVLSALMQALACSASDLLQLGDAAPAQKPEGATKPPRRAGRAKTSAVEGSPVESTPPSVLGPKVAALPSRRKQD